MWIKLIVYKLLFKMVIIKQTEKTIIYINRPRIITYLLTTPIYLVIFLIVTFLIIIESFYFDYISKYRNTDKIRCVNEINKTKNINKDACDMFFESEYRDYLTF